MNWGLLPEQCVFYPMLKDAKKAMEDAGQGVVSEELQNTLLNIIVSPGIVSVSVHPHYNGGVAYALFLWADQPETY